MQNKFYVYEWYNIDTNEIFYVGKGCGDRYQSLCHRNQKFLNYIKNNKVDSRIVLNNLIEEEAFQEEDKLIEYYKTQGQPLCNLVKGGTGGVSFVWTDEFKEYWSKNNPMKRPEQRERMSKNNPMKNPETVAKVRKQRLKPLMVGDTYYEGGPEAAKGEHVDISTIYNWCKRGYSTDYRSCYYIVDGPKPFAIPKKGKAVLIDGVRYETIKEAATAMGCKDSSPLCKALKLHKIYKGHICEYADQQPSQTNVENESSLEGSTTNE